MAEPCILLGRVDDKLFKDTSKQEADDEEAQVQAALCKRRHILCIGNATCAHCGFKGVEIHQLVCSIADVVVTVFDRPSCVAMFS